MVSLNPVTLFKSFRDITSGLVVKHYDDAAIVFVRGFVDKMSKLVATFDKYLKTKGVDFGDMKNKTVAKARDYKGKALDTVKSIGVDVKNKGAKGYVKDKASAIKGKLMGMFKSDTEGATAPPGQESEEGKKASPFAVILNPLALLTAQISKLTKVNSDTLEHSVETEKANEKKEVKRSLFDRFKSGFSFGKSKADKRAKEVEDEKNGVKGKDGKKKGIFGSVIGAIGGMTMSLIKFLPGAIGTVLSGVFLKILPALVPGLAGAAKVLSGGLLKGMGTLAWAGTKQVAMFAGRALFMNPIGIGVIATGVALYGGLKLYKLLTENSTGSGTAKSLTELRLRSYGYNDTVKSEYNKIFSLEEMMGEYVSNKKGKAVFSKFDRAFKNNVAEIFETKVDEKYKFTILNTWFMGRFLPAYKAFMDAFYSTGTTIKYIDDLDKMPDSDAFILATHLRYPLEIYNVKQIPYFSNFDTPVDKSEVDNLLASIRTKTTPKTEGADKLVTAAARDERKIAEAKAKAKEGPPPIEVKPPMPDKTPELKGKDNVAAEAAANGDGEGKEAGATGGGASPGGKPKDTNVGDVKKASGNLMDGGKSLEGMKLNKINSGHVHSLDPNVFKLLAGMAKEYKDLTGKDIQINDAYRSRAEQEYLYKTKPKGEAARPGTSLHEKGLAIDIASVDTAVLEKMGLLRKYGFTRPIGGETWHVEPAGVSLNPTEARDRPEVREARILSSIGKGGGGYGSVEKKPRGGRNIELQKKLFSQDVGSIVDVEKFKKDQGLGVPEAAKSSAMPTVPDASVVGGKRSDEDTGDGSSDENSEGDGAVTTPGGLKQYSTGDSADDAFKPKSKVVAKKRVEGVEVAKPKPLDTKVTPKTTEAYAISGPMSTMSTRDNATASSTSDVASIVKNAALRVGVNPETLLAFAKIESSLKVGAKNSKSTATGLLQIVEPTWKSLVARRGTEFGVPANATPDNPEYNAIMGAVYAKENLAELGGMHKASGVREDVALYLAHHFGASGAKRILAAYKDNTDGQMYAAVSEKSFNSNRQELTGKTVKQYIEYLNSKVSGATGTGGGTYVNPQSKIDPSQRYGTTATEPAPKPVSTTPKSYYTPEPSSDTFTPSNTPAPAGTYVNPQAKIDPAQRYGGIESLKSRLEDNLNKGISLPAATVTAPISQLNNRVNSITGSLNNAINPPINSVNQGINSITGNINNGINSVKNSLGSAISNPINRVTDGINSVTGGITNGINSVSNSLGNMFKPRNTLGAGGGATSQSPPPQSSQALSLDKTESLLGNMNDTLVQIKTVLETIAGKGGMSGGAPNAVQPDAAQQQQTPVVAEKSSAPSEFGVSMSRRSVTA